MRRRRREDEGWETVDAAEVPPEPAFTRESSPEPPAGRGRRIAAAVGAFVILTSGALAGSDAPNAVGASTDNGVSAKTPAQIIAASQAALSSASDYVVNEKVIENGALISVRLVDAGASRAEIQIGFSDVNLDVITVAGEAYVRANKAFWLATKTPRAASVANHWLEAPLSASQALTTGFVGLSPTTFSRCIGEDLGTLTKTGTTSIGGTPAVLLHDAGDHPGDAPETLAVATRGPAYPLRFQTTGAKLAGGRIDACNNGVGTETEREMTLSDFNHAPAIRAPIGKIVKLGTIPSTTASGGSITGSSGGGSASAISGAAG